MYYQIYFRSSRGGIGIPYELAKAEFLWVFRDHAATITREWWAKNRMWIELHLPPDRVSPIAAKLGYTDAVLHLQYEPYCGEEIRPIERGRWYTGWVRENDQKILQTEIYVQDKDSLLALAPHNRTFGIQERRGVRAAFGHRAHRALSPVDARFLLNLAEPGPSDLCLDPFAGYGGLVCEAQRRGHTMIATDIDRCLAPGLLDLLPGSCGQSDTRHLPILTASVDRIITEPPFRSTFRSAFEQSLPELLRVLKPSGRMILLVAAGMETAVTTYCEAAGALIRQIGTIPRGGGLKCPVVCATSPGAKRNA